MLTRIVLAALLAAVTVQAPPLPDQVVIAAPAAPDVPVIAATVGRPVHVALPDELLKPGAHLLDWSWDFGDGRTLPGFNAAAIYDRPGFYTIRLNGQPFARVEVRPDPRPIVRVAFEDELRAAAAIPDRIIELPPAISLEAALHVAAGVELRGPPTGLAVLTYGGPEGPIIRPAAGVTLRGLAFDVLGAAQGKLGRICIQGADDLAVIDCEVRNADDLVNGNSRPDRVLIAGCRTATDMSLRSYLAWVEGTQWVIAGNRAHNSTREHIIRVSSSGPQHPGASLVLVYGNDFGNTDRRGAAVNPDPFDIGKSACNLQVGTWLWADSNRFRGESGTGPLSKDGLEAKHLRARYVVYNGNTHEDTLTIEHGAHHVRIDRATVLTSLRAITNDGGAVVIAGPSETFGREVQDVTIARTVLVSQYRNVPMLKVHGDIGERFVLDRVSWAVDGHRWQTGHDVPLIIEGGWEPHYEARGLSLPPPAGGWPDANAFARFGGKNDVGSYVTAATWARTVGDGLN